MAVMLRTPTPRERTPGGTPIETAAGPAALLLLADGRWAVVSDADIFLHGFGARPAEALADFEKRFATR